MSRYAEHCAEPQTDEEREEQQAREWEAHDSAVNVNPAAVPAPPPYRPRRRCIRSCPAAFAMTTRTTSLFSMQFHKATRKQTKLRIGLSGASGFGKTYSALLLAYGLTADWSKIFVIDTENGSAELYSDLGDYNALTLLPPYPPERYREAIKAAIAEGAEVLIIDSISHEWEGAGGCLEIADGLSATSRSGNSYVVWANVSPRHRAFIDAILQAPCHVITTVRRKQDYELGKNEHGKATVTKVGTKEVTRDGFEYELTANLEILNDAHYVRASKDRTRLFMGQPEFVITPETGRALLEWANRGQPDEVLIAVERARQATTVADLKEMYNALPELRYNPTFVDALSAARVRIQAALQMGAPASAASPAALVSEPMADESSQIRPTAAQITAFVQWSNKQPGTKAERAKSSLTL